MSKLDAALLKAYEQDDPPRQPKTCEPPPEFVRLSDALGQFRIEDGSAEPALRPMLQVDAFAWPAALATTTPRIDAELDAVAGVLVEPGTCRPSVVAMVGSATHAGCTTLLLGAARRLAQRGASVVLVDADETKPELSSQLGLLPSLGWEDVAAGRQPLAEVLIESIEDRLTLLPLCRPKQLAEQASAPVAAANLARAMTTLRQTYDLVLVDLGAPGGWVTGALDETIDVAVLVHNVGRAAADDIRSASQQLAARHIACAGVIENFTPVGDRASYRRAA